MAMPNTKSQTERRRGPRRWVQAALAAAIAVLALGMVWGYYAYYPRKLGPAQPIAFSHKLHAGDKQINCLFCHAGAADTSRSGVPPLETCMLCHSRIITEHPEILKLRAAYAQNRPIEWVRVNKLPDHAYFNHAAHVRAGFDCGRCHGDVAGMDRVFLVQDFKMGFCVQCHRDEAFSHDCLICHR